MQHFKISTGLFFAVLWLWVACESSPYKSKMVMFFKKGNQALKGMQHNLAIRYFTEGIKADSTYPDIFNNRGVAYFEIRRYAEAIADYTQAIRLNPNYIDAYFNRSNAYYETKQYEKALSDLNRVAQTYKDSAYVFKARANVHIQLANYSAALQDLDQSLALNPKQSAVWISKGLVFYYQNNFEQAEKIWKETLQKFTDNQEFAYNNLGMLYARQKKIAQAMEMLNKALAINPSESYFENNKAFAYLQDNQPDQALPLIEKALKADNENAWGYRNKAYYFLQKQQPDQALPLLQQAQKLAKNIELVDFLIAEAYQQNKQIDKACEYWQKSMQRKEPEAAAKLKTFCK